ncbi:MAG: hypothetical protein ACREDZ_00330, partial [Kiloniellales bacterium]
MRRKAAMTGKVEARALPLQALVAASFLLLLGAALALSAQGATGTIIPGDPSRAAADNAGTAAPQVAPPLQLAQEAIDLGASAEEKIREVIESQLSAFQRDDASE